MMKGWCDIKARAFGFGGPEDDKRVTILNNVIQWTRRIAEAIRRRRRRCESLGRRARVTQSCR